jgi:hypothetical protein
LNEEEARILKIPKNANLFVYDYAIAAKARKDDNDDEFMRNLRLLLITFKQRRRLPNANHTDERGGSSNAGKGETTDKIRKDVEKVSYTKKAE